MRSTKTRTVVLTGGSDGIGAAAAHQLAGPNTRLILVGRSPEKTREVATATRSEFHVTDFTRLDEVRELAERLNSQCDRIDVLANNAGGMFSGPIATGDGFERTFQVNHLAPYLLTNLLRKRLIASSASVILTASVGARLFGNIDLDDLNGWESFSANRAYGNGKLANILFAKSLHAHLHAAGLSSVAFHPGLIRSNFASATDSYFQAIYHGALKSVLSSPSAGGARLKFFIDGEPGHGWASGTYYSAPGRVGRTHRQAADAGLTERHWQLSAAMLGVDWG